MVSLSTRPFPGRDVCISTLHLVETVLQKCFTGFIVSLCEKEEIDL